MEINALSSQETTYLIKELLVALRAQTNNAGIMQVEPTLRLGNNTDAITLCTHDFSDPTTWYQRSKRHTSELLNSEDRTTFRVMHYPVINADSPRLYCRDNALPGINGIFESRDKYRLIVKINGEIIYNTDLTYSWTINYMTGDIMFNNRVPNDKTITVDYYAHDESVINKSLFVLKPPPGQGYIIEHVETQFSQTTTINDSIHFEMWAGSPDPSIYLNKAYCNSPMNPWRQTYRCAHDFINNCNLGQGSIPAFGGNNWRGLQSNTIVFPFNYVQAFPICSTTFSEFHIYLDKDLPYTDCEIATCAFYTVLAPPLGDA